MDKSTKTGIEIMTQIHKKFPDCNFQVQDNLIWIRRGKVVLHTLDFNTLEYYYNTNQLEKHLKEIQS